MSTPRAYPSQDFPKRQIGRFGGEVGPNLMSLFCSGKLRNAFSALFQASASSLQKRRNTEATIRTAEQFKRSSLASARSNSPTLGNRAYFSCPSVRLSAPEKRKQILSVWRMLIGTDRRSICEKENWQGVYVPLFPCLKPFLSDLWQRSRKPTTENLQYPFGQQAIYSPCKRPQFTLFSSRDFTKIGIVRQITSGLDERMAAKLQRHSDAGKLIYDTYTSELDGSEEQYEKKLIESLKW